MIDLISRYPHHDRRFAAATRPPVWGFWGIEAAIQCSLHHQIHAMQRAIANLNASGLWIYFPIASFFSRSICSR
jgi:hypothetical protein